MLKKTFITVSVLACLCFGFVSLTTAAKDQQKVPEKMTLKTTKDKAKKPKIVKDFPHKEHQKLVENDCGVCHHGKDKDNKQTPYVKDMKIEKCETCHFKGSGMPSKKDKAKKIKKLDTFKAAAHVTCKGCHKKMKKEKPELKTKWKKIDKKCGPCHIKKKKK